jgi:hypothetical protein
MCPKTDSFESMKQECFCGRGGTAGLTASCVQAKGVLAPMSGACASLVRSVR